MVSLFLAFTRPLPSTTEVMEPYSTIPVPTSLLAPPFCLKNTTPPAIRAMTTTSAMIRRIKRRRFFLSAGLFPGFFAAGAGSAAGAAVSAGVSSFFSSMISAMSFLLYSSQGPGPISFQFIHANIVKRANQQQNSNKLSQVVSLCKIDDRPPQKVPHICKKRPLPPEFSSGSGSVQIQAASFLAFMRWISTMPPTTMRPATSDTVPGIIMPRPPATRAKRNTMGIFL